MALPIILLLCMIIVPFVGIWIKGKIIDGKMSKKALYLFLGAVVLAFFIFVAIITGKDSLFFGAVITIGLFLSIGVGWIIIKLMSK